jgi:hypothetical protein
MQQQHLSAPADQCCRYVPPEAHDDVLVPHEHHWVASAAAAAASEHMHLRSYGTAEPDAFEKL